ncbi:ABC-F family ATP-binding cassette domain-containing protein [Agromyces aerolatus]|uniref:ABC-F family ATP-binding cassette domain-containing protein n=1 Tax=Agromyces sp. LY-1074 TaxID=3074080 RepID=UPI00285AA408|nr:MULTISPECIES: ABC-F family ATP-binding cassette domain-containing protein [unclassified Agromyces]MDR5699588.1 ABC-F family ATP-binding cassette domain-containing protein [Agromyces sp. LY-1074]MDR5705884.1 ABC-F family ATP-binding cassette domain-containing protein [Agromyces sp. LY-1358]
MSLIRLNDVSLDFDGRPVLKAAYLKLARGDRVGLIGKNGTGKTSFLELVLGRREPTGGTVDHTPGTTIGYFSQFSELDGSQSVQQVLSAHFAEVHETQGRLDEIGAQLAEPMDESAMTRLLIEQGALFERMDAIGGWTYETSIDTVLTRLGFDEERRHLPVDRLSGGWRNRAALALILIQSPDVLLLDEPTNFLDLDGVRWIEGWLGGFTGAVLVVSHDRQFLDGVVDRIIEIENYRLQEYEGDYSAYVHAKQSRLKMLEKQFAHEEELLAYEQAAATARREAARNPSNAVARRLADIKKRQAPRPIDQIITGIYDGLKVSNDLLTVTGLTKGFTGTPLFDGVSFDLQRGDRVAVIGSNGSGKSTLLDVLTGETEADAGSVRWAKGARFVSYNRVYAELDLTDTVGHAVNAYPDSLAFTATKKSVNRFLAMLQFSEADLQQTIGTLSGGQRARVAIAQCLLSGAAVIVLDEPTNHLDITSTQVMERALTHFPGAVIVVSHDRFFVDKLADRLLIFEGGGRVKETPATGAL